MILPFSAGCLGGPFAAEAAGAPEESPPSFDEGLRQRERRSDEGTRAFLLPVLLPEVSSVLLRLVRCQRAAHGRNSV